MQNHIDNLNHISNGKESTKSTELLDGSSKGKNEDHASSEEGGESSSSLDLPVKTDQEGHLQVAQQHSDDDEAYSKNSKVEFMRLDHKETVLRLEGTIVKQVLKR